MVITAWKVTTCEAITDRSRVATPPELALAGSLLFGPTHGAAQISDGAHRPDTTETQPRSTTSEYRDVMASAPYRNGVGELALIFGIVAVVFSIVPIIGELVAAPTALLAVLTGCVGIRRVDRGLASNPGPAWLGTWLGVAAGFITVLVYVATLDLR